MNPQTSTPDSTPPSYRILPSAPPLSALNPRHSGSSLHRAPRKEIGSARTLLANALPPLLRTLTSRTSGSAALCVHWSARTAVATAQDSSVVNDVYPLVEAVPVPELLAAFGLRAVDDLDPEPVVLPASTVLNRMSCAAPALLREPLLARDRYVLPVWLRSGGLVAMSLPAPPSANDTWWYSGCCAFFDASWADSSSLPNTVRPGPTRAPAMGCGEPCPTLSGREREIARLLVEGYSVLNVSALVGIGENTVRTYVRRLYRKLGVCSRAQLCARLRAWPETSMEFT